MTPRERARLDQILSAVEEMIEDETILMNAGILPMPWSPEFEDEDQDQDGHGLERWRGGPM